MLTSRMAIRVICFVRIDCRLSYGVLSIHCPDSRYGVGACSGRSRGSPGPSVRHAMRPIVLGLTDFYLSAPQTLGPESSGHNSGSFLRLGHERTSQISMFVNRDNI
jgi:hypothetical protein